MWRTTWLVFSQAVTVGMALLFVVMTLKPEWLPRSSMGVAGRLPEPSIVIAAPSVQDTAGPGAAATIETGYASAARRAAPAVISIVASKMSRPNPHADDPAFRQFFGEGAGGVQPQTGLGSGVIVSAEGYLLTNNHVIEDADEIDVQLANGRQARARLIGTDPETDLAVLKIDLDRLPVMTFGDVTVLQVGDGVLAIGNPFGVGQTVTSGIVSALGRNRLGLSTFENFIQTDAAINPGNSGGALVDTAGNLVGINTAIFSRNGGNMGIGFAIPVDTARQVLQSLVRRQGHARLDRRRNPRADRRLRRELRPAGESRRADHWRAARRPGQQRRLASRRCGGAHCRQSGRQPGAAAGRRGCFDAAGQSVDRRAAWRQGAGRVGHRGAAPGGAAAATASVTTLTAGRPASRWGGSPAPARATRQAHVAGLSPACGSTSGAWVCLTTTLAAMMPTS